MSLSLTERLFFVAQEVGREGRRLFEEKFSKTIFKAWMEADTTASADVVKEGDDPRTVQTAIDRMCKDRFYEALEEFSGVNVVTEEGGQYKVAGTGYENCTVVIDDWDGSTNGSKGLNLSAISVAIDSDGRSFMGCWYDPYREYMIFTPFTNDGEELPICVLSIHRGSCLPFSGPPKRACTLSESRLVIHRGTKLHPVSDLHEHPLSTLGVQALAVMNFESSVIPLMHVAMGMVDGFVVAGNRPWDLWGARAIFTALRIPFAFMEPFTYRVLEEAEIVPDPEKEYAFACANNRALFAEIMEILQAKK